MILQPIPPRILSLRRIPNADPALLVAYGADPERHRSLGLVTVDQDDPTYVALDEATKHADVDVVFAKSFYAGSKHASGPLSGEILGVVAGEHPAEVEEALVALREHLRVVRFQSFPGDLVGGHGQPAFLAHVIAETGRYLAAQASVASGEPMAYLIAPPLESVLAVDAALKAADVKLAKWIAPPSETNFGGAFLSGALPALEAARDAFVAAIHEVTRGPLAAARRPDRMRR